MMRILFTILILLIGSFAGVFAYLNAGPVEFNYLFGETQISLAWLCGLAFTFGTILSLLLMLPGFLLRRQKIRRLERTVNACEQELTNLRNLPLKDVERPSSKG